MTIPGTMVPEELPDERSRGAVFARLRKRLKPGHAVELGGRLYADSWDLTSFSIEPRYYHTLIRDRLMARYRYRYYSQSEAEQFSEQFTAPEEFLTQDSDLGEFDTNMFGVQLIWWRKSGSTFNTSLDYALRSDGLDHIFGSIGWNELLRGLVPTCLLGAVLTLAGCSSAGSAQPAQPEQVTLASVTDMQGREYDLAAQLDEGRPVALIFWQTWCASCLREALHWSRQRTPTGLASPSSA